MINCSWYRHYCGDRRQRSRNSVRQSRYLNLIKLLGIAEPLKQLAKARSLPSRGSFHCSTHANCHHGKIQTLEAFNLQGASLTLLRSLAVHSSGILSISNWPICPSKKGQQDFACRQLWGSRCGSVMYAAPSTGATTTVLYCMYVVQYSRLYLSTPYNNADIYHIPFPETAPPLCW